VDEGKWVFYHCLTSITIRRWCHGKKKNKKIKIRKIKKTQKTKRKTKKQTNKQINKQKNKETN